jgi:hypothetical protein
VEHDFRRRIIDLTKTKNYSARTVHLNADACQLLCDEGSDIPVFRELRDGTCPISRLFGHVARISLSMSDFGDFS